MRVQKSACNNLITEARVSKSTPLSQIQIGDKFTYQGVQFSPKQVKESVGLGIRTVEDLYKDYTNLLGFLGSNGISFLKAPKPVYYTYVTYGGPVNLLLSIPSKCLFPFKTVHDFYPISIGRKGEGIKSLAKYMKNISKDQQVEEIKKELSKRDILSDLDIQDNGTELVISAYNFSKFPSIALSSIPANDKIIYNKFDNGSYHTVFKEPVWYCTECSGTGSTIDFATPITFWKKITFINKGDKKDTSKEALDALRIDLFSLDRPSKWNIQDKTLSIRDWGSWESSYDIEDEEDDDFEELTDRSAQAISKIVSKIEREYNCKIDWFTSEKNWIDFTIR